MKKIVLYGAFDRYNYGDNLMPIIFQKFIEKYHADILLQFKLEFSAISTSNLEEYQCLKTTSINKVIKKLPEGSTIIVIGGEVLNATNENLYLHMQKNSFFHKIVKKFKQKLPKAYKAYTNLCYSTYWDFPFVINKRFLTKNIKVIYNTVGGRLDPLDKNNHARVFQRIKEADYFSVRDTRTLNDINKLSKAVLSPDSVFLLPDIIDSNFLQNNISANIKSFATDHNQYVFQAAPNKIDCSFEELTEQIALLSKNSKSKVVLLPIGYASGHDDVYILSKINRAIPNETVMLADLNLWEILYVIKNCKAFIGTSLHGVITAMAYGIPHFGINKNISKLNAFLSEWSLKPYNQCYSAANISYLPDNINFENNKEILLNAKRLIAKVKLNNDAIINKIIEN